MGYLPVMAFAKFDRSKPHLNVGTIGKWLIHLSWRMAAVDCQSNTLFDSAVYYLLNTSILVNLYLIIIK
jgi:hypothetical protein